MAELFVYEDFLSLTEHTENSEKERNFGSAKGTNRGLLKRSMGSLWAQKQASLFLPLKTPLVPMSTLGHLAARELLSNPNVSSINSFCIFGAL